MTITPLNKREISAIIWMGHRLWYKDLCAQADKIANASVLTRCEAISLLLQRPGTAPDLVKTIVTTLIPQLLDEKSTIARKAIGCLEPWM